VAAWAWLLGLLVLALLHRLKHSLHTTEQALRERDEVNRLLEERVNQRTRELEAALLAAQASEAKYRALFTLPAGVTVAEASGRIVEVNSAAEEMLGVPTDFHLTRRFDDPAWDIIQPDGTPFPVEALPIVVAQRDGRTVTNVEMGVAHPDGGRVWLSVSAAPLDLTPSGVVVTYTDLTLRKEAELRLASELRVPRRSPAARASCSSRGPTCPPGSPRSSRRSARSVRLWAASGSG
jgi:PAS domain S-box-containing protein